MEVKNIFAHLIMKTYEREHLRESGVHGMDGEKKDVQPISDAVSISEGASMRFFRDIMENSLQKGLNGVVINEGS